MWNYKQYHVLLGLRVRRHSFSLFGFVSSLDTLSGLAASEERKLYSVTQVFFRAASSPSTRRSMSVDPGVSLYATDNRHSPPPTSPPETEPALQTLTPIHLLDDVSQRGRMRLRRLSSADNLVFQRDPVAHLNRPSASSPHSYPLATEEAVATHTSTSSHLVQSPTSTSPAPLVETPTPACGCPSPPNTPATLLNFFDRRPSTQDPWTLSHR
jgi:hypothetical protein